MRIATLTALAALSLLTACNAPEANEGTASAEIGNWATYGGEVSENDAVTVETLLANPERYAGKTLVVEGTIDQPCPKKGCWMTFQSGDEELRVTFEDYGFFVPLDSAGDTARFEGTFDIVEVPEDEAKHYLEDAGDLEGAAAIVGPQRTYSLVATGVRIRD